MRPFGFAVLAALAAFTMVTPRASVAATGSIILSWTAPGDDSLLGTVASYDIRYSTTMITESNFSTKTRVLPSPTPVPAGGHQTATVSNLTAGTSYYFAIKSSDEALNWSRMSNVALVTVPLSVGVGDAPIVVNFSAPSPNPARGDTRFAVGVPTSSPVEIEAFDISGRRVRRLMSGEQPAGASSLVWNLRGDDGQPLSSGLYLVRARIGGTSFVRRVTIER